ncbi:hypothetical protein L204_103148 [Cryptococcus depauperatus]
MEYHSDDISDNRYPQDIPNKQQSLDRLETASSQSVNSQSGRSNVSLNAVGASSNTNVARPSADRRLSVGLGAPSGGTFAGLSALGGFAGQGKGDDNNPVGFDEAILRGLCEMDCALPLLVDRIKQSIASCKQVATFFRSRAEIEEKYARSLHDLYRATSDVYARADCKAGSFVSAYNSSLKIQEHIAQNRLRFAQRLMEMSEELFSLAREGEKARKTHKETGSRYQLIIQDAETSVDKSKIRLDGIVEELDRVLAAKEGEAYKDVRSGGHTIGGPQYGFNQPQAGKSKLGKAMKTGGLLFKGKGAGSLQKQEDDSRSKMDQANETFQKAVAESKQLRKEYFSFQLPKVLRLLKEVSDELDLGTQYHLTRFAWLYENMTVSDGTVLNPLGAPDEGPGLKVVFENIDNRSDFKSYMQNYAVARGTPKGPRRDGPYDDGFPTSVPRHLQRSNDLGTGHNLPANNSPQSSAQSSSQLPQAGHSHSSSPQPPQSLQYHSQTQTQPSHFSNPSIGSVHTVMSPSTIPSSAQPHQPSSQPLPQTQPQSQSGQIGPSENATLSDYVPSGIPASTGATFGVDLGEQLLRDETAVPKVVEKCAQAIEMYGLESTGVYRLSGTTSRVQALKAALDKDVDAVDIMSDDWSADINVVCGVLKLWFRELPEPLLTFGLYHGFIEAARYENDRLRHIRLHEQVNELPDPNYATLKYFMGHLDKIRKRESVNHMSVSNLSIVFGPTLLGAPPVEGGLNLEHMSYQCKAIETILDKYHEIFVEEEEET